VTAGDIIGAVAGALTVGVVVLDVFYTVLFPASGHGPLRRPLSRWTWRLFAVVAGRLSERRRRDLLAYSGPAQILVTFTTWLVLLVTGWALVFHPALGSGVVASTGRTDAGWATAFYFSGFAITTLGTGDVVPASGLYRILTVAEAALGFSVFTMVLTYFLSIYGSITSRKTFSSSLHHRTYDTGSPAQLLVGMSRVGDIDRGSEQLSQLAHFLTYTMETHRSYPVLRYFHFRDARYALPRLLLLALDTVALLRLALDDSYYEGLGRSPVVFELQAAGMELLTELVPEAPDPGASPSRRKDLTEHFRHAVDVLRADGLKVTSDDRAEEYVALREVWDGRLRALAAAMVYPWNLVEAGVG
jgi:hypothetical protein